MRAHSYSASDAGTIRTARPPCGCQSDRPRALPPPQALILRPLRGNLPALHRYHARYPRQWVGQGHVAPSRGGPGAWPCTASFGRMHRLRAISAHAPSAAASGADRVDHAPLHEYPLCQLKYGTAAATRRPTSWYCADTHLLETTRQHQLPIRIATSLLAPRRSLGAGDAAWRRRTRGRGRWRARYADGSAPAGARRP